MSTKSQKTILEILKEQGQMTPKEIMQETSLSPRTVGYALRSLLKSGEVRRAPNLQDLRQYIYVAED